MAVNPFWIQAKRDFVSQRMESFDRLFEEQKKAVGRLELYEKPKDALVAEYYRSYESLQEAKQDLAESEASLSAEAEQQTSWKRVSME